MIITKDSNFIGHYYHWIGELFLGSWRVWSHYQSLGNSLPEPKTIAFLQQTNDSDRLSNVESWEDHAGANRWFTSTFLPGVDFETKQLWDQRAASNTLYRIPLAIIVDRWAGHRGSSAGHKPFGDALRLPVPPDYLTRLRDKIYRPTKHFPVITYLSRQDTTRRLRQAAHEALVEALMALHDIAEVKVEVFVDKTPFEEQVAKIANTDILIGVHGNGLTHTLWMNPGTAVFEIQPAWCNINDYSPLAIAAGVQHYMVHFDSFCKPLECPPRGCVGDDKDPSRSVNVDTIEVQPSVIVDEIRRILANRDT